MDYLNTLTRAAPIQHAIQLILQAPVSHQWVDFYKRSTRNELAFLGAATLLTAYNLVSYIKTRRQRLNLPPTVPLSLPLVGHTLYMMTMSNKFIDWCNKNYGELYNLNFLGKQVTVASGKCAEEALKADQSDLSLEEGIVKGIKANPIVAKATVASSKMPMYIHGIQVGLERGVEALFNEDGATVVETPSPFFQNFVAYMSVPTLLGEEMATNVEVIRSFAEFTGDITKNVGIFMMLPKFLHPYLAKYLQSASKHHQVMEKYVAPVIQARREKMKQAQEAGVEHGLEYNFLQGLMEFENTDDPSKPYTEKEIAHAVLLVAFASVHTTSMNLSFAIYWLIARPDLKATLLEEIEHFAPGNTHVTHEALHKMQFLNNFMREVLRQGVDKLANGKKALNDYTFKNGYQVPKGRSVNTTLRQLNFGDNVTRSTVAEMDPAKSLNKASTSPAKDFASFGMGKHMCPGRFFAVQEIEMSLIYLLKHFDIDTVSGNKPYPVAAIAGAFATNCEDPLVFTRKNPDSHYL
ncbi:cytochrome P450 [Parasitella parasitica]|nr:cytochrome P450 [Parasitella parasitica]